MEIKRFRKKLYDSCKPLTHRIHFFEFESPFYELKSTALFWQFIIGKHSFLVFRGQCQEVRKKP